MKIAHWVKLGIAGTLIAVASWAIFQMANDFFNSLVMRFGITNPYITNTFIVVVVILIMFVFGYSFKQTLKKALR